MKECSKCDIFVTFKNIILCVTLIFMDQNSLVIAVVEDEDNLRSTLEFALEKAGYTVWTYSNGLEAWEAFNKKLPDLIISDIMMPMMDGLELCRNVRSQSMDVPIIFLTSKDEEFDKILGLELGADDYLCKPFSLRELITRIKVIFRRVNIITRSSNAVVRAGELTLNTDTYTGEINNKDIKLTVTEFRLLHSLMQVPGHVKTREQLIKTAYPEDSYISDRNVDCHIKRLRKKINGIEPGFDNIQTVYGLGYKLVSQKC